MNATTLGATVNLFSLFQPQVVNSSGIIALKHGKSRRVNWLAISSGGILSAEQTTSSHDWLIEDAGGKLLVLYWYTGSCCLWLPLSPRLEEGKTILVLDIKIPYNHNMKLFFPNVAWNSDILRVIVITGTVILYIWLLIVQRDTKLLLTLLTWWLFFQGPILLIFMLQNKWKLSLTISDKDIYNTNKNK